MRATELLTSLMFDINKKLPDGAKIRFLYQEQMGIADGNKYNVGFISDKDVSRTWTIEARGDRGEYATRNKYFPPIAIAGDLPDLGGSLRLADLRDIVLESEM